MNSTRKLLSVLCLVFCSSAWHSKAQQTTYNIGDDGFAAVAIPFDFPFYGQTFRESWMYDNGIVSFINPNTPGAVSPGQWSAPQSIVGAGNYFIAPLWADISPTKNTVYSTSADGTSLKYTWNNISEYYSGGTRLSSFSTTIKPTGEITTNYYSLNLNSSNILVGTAGNNQAGEYTQIYEAGFGTQVNTTTLPNWTLSTYAPLPPRDPCLDDAMSSPLCPGYLDAIKKLTPTTEATVQSSPPVISEPVGTVEIVAPQSSQPPVADVGSTTQIAVVPSTNPISPVVQSVGPTSERSSSAPSLSSVLNIVRAEQSRISLVESTTVQQANQTAAAASSQAQQQSEAVAATDVAASQTQQSTQQSESVAAMSVATSQAQQSSRQSGSQNNGNASSQNSSVGLTSAASQTSVVSVGGLRGPDQSTGVSYVDGLTSAIASSSQTSRVNDIQLISTPPLSWSQPSTQIFQPSTSRVDVLQNIELDNKTNINFTISPIKDYLDDKVGGVVEPQRTNQLTGQVRRNVPENDAAGGVAIASIAKQPVGFELYQVGIKDSPFYAPKEVYRNQRTVDNQSALRQLSGKSDQLHQRMVDQQYKRGN